MNKQQVKILCVDDEQNVLKALCRLFMDEDYEILTAPSGEKGLEVLSSEPAIQVIISDYRMPGMNGVDFLKQVYDRWPDTMRIVLSGYADTATVVAAVNEGHIYKFMPKPWNDDELKIAIAHTVETYFLQKENQALTEKLGDSNEELKILNENLERLVKERTSELIFQNKVLVRAQHILDHLPCGVMGLDTEGLIVQCNRRAVEILGQEGKNLFGMAGGDILPEELNNFITNLGKGEIHSDKIMVGQQNVRIDGVAMYGDEGKEGVIIVVIPENA